MMDLHDTSVLFNDELDDELHDTFDDELEFTI